jgi:hypothetical protein
MAQTILSENQRKVLEAVSWEFLLTFFLWKRWIEPIGKFENVDKIQKMLYHLR